MNKPDETQSRRPLIAAIWAISAMFATAAVLPYTLALAPDILDEAKLPLPALVGLQMAQAGIVLFALSWVGLRLGPTIGLGSPLLVSLTSKQPLPSDTKRTLALAALVGAIAGGLIVGFDMFFNPLMPAASQPVQDIAWWKGLLASFYGGIVEELQLRLFFMTFVAWILSRIFRGAGPAVMTASIILAAIAFGAGHLPAASKIWALTSIVVTRTIVLNALGGIVFGVVYWKRGLEHAMVAHFSADIVLHVIVAG